MALLSAQALTLASKPFYHSRVRGKYSHLWRVVWEHATHWVVGGAILVATGFAPEEWLAHTVHGLHIPKDMLHLWAAGVDVRVVPIAVGVALIGGNLLWRQRTPNAKALPIAVPEPAALSLPDKPSIAVLRFDNLSSDPTQEYFSDGVAEDVITELSRSRSIFVISRNSSFTYRGRAMDVKQIARELGVRYVLEGSVRREGDRIRVTAQLIEAESGSRYLGRTLRPRPEGLICHPGRDNTGCGDRHRASSGRCRNAQGHAPIAHIARRMGFLSARAMAFCQTESSGQRCSAQPVRTGDRARSAVCRRIRRIVTCLSMGRNKVS